MHNKKQLISLKSEWNRNWDWGTRHWMPWQRPGLFEGIWGPQAKWTFSKFV